jgi:hypothetical protein
MKKYSVLYCKSGFSMSVQAGKHHYCEPRSDHGPYTAVEVGGPSCSEPLLMQYAEDPDAPTKTVYGWVPVGLVQALIIKHGGIEEGEHPVFDIDAEQSFEMAKAIISEN